MLACLPHLSPGGYRSHILHGIDRCWPETNCSVDVWIELLHTLNLPPEPALAIAARQDFEGDQFGFTKLSLDDLELLYGLRVQELALYDDMTDKIALQIGRRRLCFVEADAFYLPDTGAAAYRRRHSKTTIGVNKLDRAHSTAEYFHNGGYFGLEGEDYQAIFGRPQDGSVQLYPYIDYTSLDAERFDDNELRRRAAFVLQRHWMRRPAENPIRAFQRVLPTQAAMLEGRGPQALYDYAFHTARLLGSNFSLLGACLGWNGEANAVAVAQCDTIAESAKSLPLRLAKAVAQRRYDRIGNSLDPAANAWDRLFEKSDAQAVA
jgi:hypothetical protein